MAQKVQWLATQYYTRIITPVYLNSQIFGTRYWFESIFLSRKFYINTHQQSIEAE